MAPKKSAGQTFFEAFRRPESSKAPGWWSKTIAVQADTEKEGSTNRRAPRPNRDATTPSGRLVLTFSREALVIYALIILGVLAFSHTWAYSRGAKNTPEAALLPPNGSDTREGAAIQRTPFEQAGTPVRALNMPTSPFYTLRICTHKSRATAGKMRDNLKREGYNVFIYRDGNNWPVCVGNFTRTNSPECEKAKRDFKAKVYERKTPFADCYVIRITNFGSIEP